MTSGDVAEALNWLTQLDKKYGLTNDEYGMGNFIQDLKDKNYIEEEEPGSVYNITAKTGAVYKAAVVGRDIRKIKEIRERKSPHSLYRSGR